MGPSFKAFLVGLHLIRKDLIIHLFNPKKIGQFGSKVVSFTTEESTQMDLQDCQSSSVSMLRLFNLIQPKLRAHW
jgi:hypothetical protein